MKLYQLIKRGHKYLNRLKAAFLVISGVHVNIKQIDLFVIDYVFNKESALASELIDEVMSFDASNFDFRVESERAYPGNPEFSVKEYYNVMLKRYFFPSKFYCRNKEVLDSCSGLGWGSYIISNYAKSVTSFDIDSSSSNSAKKTWNATNIDWVVGNALDPSFLSDSKFDVAFAMETIEHFSKADGILYIQNLSNRLRKNGILIGTSAFPLRVEDAIKLKAKNPYHLHIFTYSEIYQILNQFFSEFTIVNNWMFIAKK